MQMSKPLKGTVLIIKALAMNFCTVRSATQCACKTIRSSGKDQFPAIISVCLSPGHWVIQSDWNILKSIKSLTHCDFPQKKPCQHDIRISSRQQALLSQMQTRGCGSNLCLSPATCRDISAPSTLRLCEQTPSFTPDTVPQLRWGEIIILLLLF